MSNEGSVEQAIRSAGIAKPPVHWRTPARLPVETAMGDSQQLAKVTGADEVLVELLVESVLMQQYIQMVSNNI